MGKPNPQPVWPGRAPLHRERYGRFRKRFDTESLIFWLQQLLLVALSTNIPGLWLHDFFKPRSSGLKFSKVRNFTKFQKFITPQGKIVDPWTLYEICSEFNGESFLPNDLPRKKFIKKIQGCRYQVWPKHLANLWKFQEGEQILNFLGKKDSPFNSERISYRVHGSAIFPQGVMKMKIQNAFSPLFLCYFTFSDVFFILINFFFSFFPF
jgi:hypothetical protein